LAAAPKNFGPLSNTLLITNNVTESGVVNAFNAFIGQFVSTLKDTSGKNITIRSALGHRVWRRQRERWGDEPVVLYRGSEEQSAGDVWSNHGRALEKDEGLNHKGHEGAHEFLRVTSCPSW
jgi:hypothetical protein